ncbi:GNAT family N-acetyltransferase [Pseudolysinimonas sp.]|uniref:GNAT family N-acetyltransferase n=1 Tax=Pseudolysinimonas sp. TaxID=2680009 RepID=UPI0037850371
MSDLDVADLLERFERARARDDFDGAPAERDGPVVRVEYPHGGFIAAPSDTGVRGAALDELIARQRDHFAARGIQVEWKTYAYDEPADLTARLEAAGFVAEERETVVVGSVDALSGHPAEVDGVTIRETTDPADFRAIGELHTEIWDDDWTWIADDLRDQAQRLGPDGFRVLVADDGERLVSAAWLVLRAGTEFASLWGGSTLEAFRGRGIYRALVARRAAVARDAGYRYLQVDASDMSRPILARLGFVALTTTTPYVAGGA